ncbi:efflux transporter outer membrane subunit [Acidicapsa dinghuensis]|uniref:Efflux transporter outer membrane subunit n=1 Tax=Acidicapsa dinghuensis TaxID=2218256 RepID=A0ABW1ELT0_9BACT|nr:efflux transporter outer membrane subunit [Acidicapsa dinghuensis]
MRPQRLIPLTLLSLAAIFTGCKVGPNYVRPQAAAPPAYQEAPPSADSSSPDAGQWKTATPSDADLKGDWWQLFSDPVLGHLEEQVATANQTLKAAEANFRAARSAIGVSKSYLAPTISVAPSIGAVRESANQPYVSQNNINGGEGSFELPVDLSYEVDLWGRIRRGITAAREQAQAASADLATARLSLQAELALDYFNLRATDAQIQLLNDTVKAYSEALKLTKDRYDEGVAPLSDVSQAQTQLDAAQVTLTDLANDRAAAQHAIAVLIGQPPADFHLDPLPHGNDSSILPAIPVGIPSQLLERRPDIASMERHMASANEQIGIAQAAYYPTLSLSATAGFLGTSALNWFTWPSRLWAVGPTLTQTLFDAGRRKSNVAIVRAQYDETVANYRQTVLTSFQQVEDNLAALRVLQQEAAQQHAATKSAEQTLDLFTTRYEGGVDTYLQVITSQTVALQNERNDIAIQLRRQQASVLLIKALGGGWTTQQLPPV